MKCTIWKQLPNGKFNGIMCYHSKGVAELLLEKWADDALIDSLLELGHISRLGDHLTPKRRT